MTTKLDEMEKRTDGVEKWNKKMETLTDNVEQRVRNVEERTDYIEQWTENMEIKTDNLVKKLVDFQKLKSYTECGGFYNGYLI